MNRHRNEIIVSSVAVVIAAISLWVAIDTDYTNRQMVAEQAWPHLQIYNSAHGSSGERLLSLNIANAGVGPAKIESLEVFWQDRPYADSASLLSACCGFAPDHGPAAADRPADAPHALSTSTAAGTVLRAGDAVRLLGLSPVPGDEAAYAAFGSARGKIGYRVCYCSIFNECWLSDGHNLNPPRVKACPQPAVPYSE